MWHPQWASMWKSSREGKALAALRNKAVLPAQRSHGGSILLHMYAKQC